MTVIGPNYGRVRLEGTPLENHHRVRVLEGCTCTHEDWQHASLASCAGGQTGSSCPCIASWREVGWSKP